MSEWKTYKLSEVVEIKYGKDHKHLADGEIPLYGSGGIMRYVDKPLYEQESILIPRKGTLSNLFYLNIPFWSVDTMFYTKIKEGNNGKYLYYLLKSMDLASMNVGSAVPSLTTEVLNKVEINVPDETTQIEIAQILTSLDNKIEINLQMNQTLETMAQALFKEWFVNFNFPNFDGELENDLPKGWRMGKLKDISTNFDNKRVPLSSMQRKDRQGIYPYYGAATIFDYIDDYIFDGTYLLIGEDGTVQTDEGFPLLQYVWGKFWVNNHTHVLQGKSPFSTEYLYLLLSKTNITHLITGAVQPKINQGNMNKIECVLPTEKILNDFQKAINPIFEKIKANKIQIQALTQTRDTLLPKLMSGKIGLNYD